MLTIYMDIQIMRRSKRHIIKSESGATEYVANTFEQALEYLEAIDQRQVQLAAGERRLIIELTGGAGRVDDPRQLKILGVLTQQ